MPKKELGLSSPALARKICRKPQKLKRRKVLKMLAVMEAQQTAGPSNGTNTSPVTPDCSTTTAVLHAQEFLSSGRTGRRNALPDILGEHALVTSSDLPARLQSLTTSEPAQGTSKDTKDEASTSTS